MRINFNVTLYVTSQIMVHTPENLPYTCSTLRLSQAAQSLTQEQSLYEEQVSDNYYLKDLRIPIRGNSF